MGPRNSLAARSQTAESEWESAVVSISSVDRSVAMLGVGIHLWADVESESSIKGRAHWLVGSSGTCRQNVVSVGWSV